mgnify:CR=1 FL=1
MNSKKTTKLDLLNERLEKTNQNIELFCNCDSNDARDICKQLLINKMKIELKIDNEKNRVQKIKELKEINKKNK